MDIRKSLDVDLFGDLISEEKEPEAKPNLVFKTPLGDVPRTPYTVYRVSPTEVWIMHEQKTPPG